jgi:hypothetical protein
MDLAKWFGQRDEFVDWPDVYCYDELPQELRVKVWYSLQEEARYFGNPYHDETEEILGVLRTRLCRSLGRLRLNNEPDASTSIQTYLLEETPKEVFIALEHFLEMYALACGENESWRGGMWDRLKGYIEQVNTLLRWYRVGFQVESASERPILRVVRLDSKFMHAGVVRPALSLLGQAAFETAESQFLHSLEEYTQGHHADAITDAAAAFESTAKHILGVDKGDASQLIRQLRSQGYIPPYLEADLQAFNDILAALPKVRNEQSDAHGRLKTDESQLPRYAKLAINLAGSYITFLADEYQRRLRADAPDKA